MRPIRSALVLTAGFFGGFMAAAGVVKRAVPSQGDAESDEVGLVAVFDGVQLRSRATAFRGGSMLAWYGGIDADLREATLASEANLAVTALFGGISLRVPPEWRVESNLRTMAGGFDISGSDPDDPDAPTLRIAGMALFGGVAVSRKQAPVAADTATS